MPVIIDILEVGSDVHINATCSVDTSIFVNGYYANANFGFTTKFDPKKCRQKKL